MSGPSITIKRGRSFRRVGIVGACFWVVGLFVPFGGKKARRTPANQTGGIVPSVMPSVTCELPPCDLVAQSRLYSKRCGTRPAKWPLLITSTPRSATTFVAKTLQAMGMRITDDWHDTPTEHGIVSWMFAFDDDDANTFGPTRTDGFRFGRVLHQVRDPLGGIASMCTEPILRQDTIGNLLLSYLRRHISMNATFGGGKPRHSCAALEFWIEWHEFLTQMRFPTFQVESSSLEDICRMSKLSDFCNRRRPGRVNVNARAHREKFSWQELYTIDPRLAERAWELAHHLGYSYEVDFDSLTCLDYLPSCDTGENETKSISEKCPPGSHPHPTNASRVPQTVSINGLKGWVDAGCMEYDMGNETYIGIQGLAMMGDHLLSEIELDPWLLESQSLLTTLLP